MSDRALQPTVRVGHDLAADQQALQDSESLQAPGKQRLSFQFRVQDVGEEPSRRLLSDSLCWTRKEPLSLLRGPDSCFRLEQLRLRFLFDWIPEHLGAARF